MSDSVLMPALGESVTEGTVTRWLKQVGDTVALDEPLLEVSTDKVDTEIPSPFAGTLVEILVGEDETVEVGTALATIGAAGESAAAAPAPAAEPEPEPEPEPAPAAAAEPAPTAPEAPAAAAPAASGGSAQDVTMPALGESVTEGTVTRWLKQVGDSVALDEPLLEVSTDKVDTEIPSPFAGTLVEILVGEDETVEVGTALARVGEAGASAPAAAAAPAAAEPAPPAPAPAAAAPAAPAPAAPGPGSPCSPSGAGTGTGPGRGRRRRVADPGQRGADLHRLVLADQDLHERPGERRRDLGVHLVGGDLEQRLVERDAVADLLEPPGDGAFGDALTERRHRHVLGRAPGGGGRSGGRCLRGGRGGLCSGGGRRLGLGRGRGLGRRRRGGALARRADGGQRGADLHRLVLADEDLHERPGERRRDLGVHLVGGDLEQRLVERDGVADLLEPPGDGAFGDALTERGHQHGVRHDQASP